VATSTLWNQSTAAGVAGPRAETAPQPVAEKERIVSIDALRGFALLGILYMNIQALPRPTTKRQLARVNLPLAVLSHSISFCAPAH
jgi:uncharacterized membrane protein YeiB